MLCRLDGIVMLMVVTMGITHLHGRHGRKINGKDTATQIEPSKCQLFLRPYLKPDFNCSLRFFLQSESSSQSVWFKFRYSKSYRRQSGRHRAALSAIRPTWGMTAIPFVLTLASIYIWVEQHHVKVNITYILATCLLTGLK